MEFPRLGVESELQLPAYTTATATGNPSRICNLHHSSRQHQIPEPLSKAWGRTQVLIDTSWIRFRGATGELPGQLVFFLLIVQPQPLLVGPPGLRQPLTSFLLSPLCYALGHLIQASAPRTAKSSALYTCSHILPVPGFAGSTFWRVGTYGRNLLYLSPYSSRSIKQTFPACLRLRGSRVFLPPFLAPCHKKRGVVCINMMVRVGHPVFCCWGS